MNIRVLYEDDFILAVDKPAGLLTIPTPKAESRTLTSILNDDLKSKGLSYRLHPCHRLDRDTSGVILYAKGKAVQQKVMELFRQRKVKKVYVAFIQGEPHSLRGQIRSSVEGLSALSEYIVIEKRKDFSIIEVMPFTGRKNQIRIHLKFIGHPLVGEDKFAFRKDFALRHKRPCLHARSLEFPHPLTGKAIHIESPLAQDLKAFLEKHR